MLDAGGENETSNGGVVKEEGEEDEDEDPYSGYVEQNGNTRAADLYLDTVRLWPSSRNHQ
jgi:hypothetical protein